MAITNWYIVGLQMENSQVAIMNWYIVGLQMENIEVFLKAVELYGVPSNSLFPTADLFEGRNMAMVISTILQFGSEVSQLPFLLS